MPSENHSQSGRFENVTKVECTNPNCEFSETPRDPAHAKALGQSHWIEFKHAVEYVK